jgi:hypothetical protein
MIQMFQKNLMYRRTLMFQRILMIRKILMIHLGRKIPMFQRILMIRYSRFYLKYRKYPMFQSFQLAPLVQEVRHIHPEVLEVRSVQLDQHTIQDLQLQNLRRIQCLQNFLQNLIRSLQC